MVAILQNYWCACWHVCKHESWMDVMSVYVYIAPIHVVH